RPAAGVRVAVEEEIHSCHGRTVVGDECSRLSLTDASPAELARARQMDLFGRDEPALRRRPWAHLLRLVFLVDVTVCPDWGGRMKWLELATETRDIHRILAELGIAPRGPPPFAHNHPAAWSAPRQLRLPF